MAAYRFKILLEDNEDFFLEIEMKATQTFENLHDFILKSINFDNIHPASFYMSDDYWRKGLELTNRTESSGNKAPAKQMKTAKIAAYIEDPHQKIIYVYDLDNAEWNFTIELTKIIEDNPKETYPKLFKSVGAAPPQYKTVAIPNEADEDEEEKPGKEKIFSSEEKYEEHDPSNDDLIEEGEEKSEEEDFSASEFGDNEHPEEL